MSCFVKNIIRFIKLSIDEIDCRKASHFNRQPFDCVVPVKKMLIYSIILLSSQ